jgi:hypothetical protein
MKKAYIKYWPKEIFSNNLCNFNLRLKFLESLSGNFESFREHKFYNEGNLIKLETEFIEEKVGPIGNKSIDPLLKLANDLIEINQFIPHGDILKRNVIWDGKNFVLIDWEPLLEYVVPPNIFFKSTKPYISSADLEKSKVTINTDKIAFFYFCRKIIHGWFPTDKKELAMLEKKILTKSFDQLVEYAMKSSFSKSHP